MKTPILLVITAVISSAVTYATIRALDGQAASVATSVEAPVNQAHTEALWEKVRANIVKDFFDPEAVRFHCVGYKEEDGLQTFLGHVNGKNRYGGYVGEKSFVWSSDTGRHLISLSRWDHLPCPDNNPFK